MPERPSWHEQMVKLAQFWSKRSTCKRDKVGAVVFDPNTNAVISVGYNDTPIRMTDCGDGGCSECAKGKPVSQNLKCSCVHAEQNALLLAAQRGSMTRGTFVATTRRPCRWCLISMHQAGVAYVIFPEKPLKPSTTRFRLLTRRVENMLQMYEALYE